MSGDPQLTPELRASIVDRLGRLGLPRHHAAALLRISEATLDSWLVSDAELAAAVQQARDAAIQSYLSTIIAQAKRGNRQAASWLKRHGVDWQEPPANG